METTVKDLHSLPHLLCACLCLRGFVSLSLVSPVRGSSVRSAWLGVGCSELCGRIYWARMVMCSFKLDGLGGFWQTGILR